VPPLDPGLVATFERPYREGAFVPPHIYADEAAVEASGRAAGAAVGEMVRGLATCRRLLVRLDSGRARVFAVSYDPARNAWCCAKPQLLPEP
jgi:hypothetical protein